MTPDTSAQPNTQSPPPAPAGMNHFCNGEWSCRSEEVPSRCGYCGEPNAALLAPESVEKASACPACGGEMLDHDGHGAKYKGTLVCASCGREGSDVPHDPVGHAAPPAKPRGVLISFEGLDGSGKTTQIELLRQRLEESGLSVAVFREPGGTPLGEEVRNLLLNKHDLSICPLAELMLFLASRSALVHDKIRPLLESGTIVLLDRFLDSTVAYQGYGRELGYRLVLDANHAATGGLEPDMTIWLDVPPDGARNWRSKSGTPDRIEQQDEYLHQRVRDGFRAQAAANDQRIKLVNGWRSKEGVHQDVWQLFILGRLLSPHATIQERVAILDAPARRSVWL